MATFGECAPGNCHVAGLDSYSEKAKIEWIPAHVVHISVVAGE